MRNIEIKGYSYPYPEENDVNWGEAATEFAEAIAAGVNENEDLIDTVAADAATALAVVQVEVDGIQAELIDLQGDVGMLQAEITEISPPSDIRDTQVTGLLDDGAWHDIPFLVVNSGVVSGMVVQYMVSRTGGSFPYVNLNTMYLTFRSGSWQLDILFGGDGMYDDIGDTDPKFRVNPTSGQVQIKSPSTGSTAFKLRFRGEAMSV